MDAVNYLVALGTATGSEEIMQIFLFLLGVFAAFMFEYLVFYALGFVLVWPRLVAKSRITGRKKSPRIRRLKRWLVALEILLLVLTPVLSWLLFPDMMKTVFLIALSYSIIFFLIWIFIRIAWHVPLLKAFIYQNRPPEFFIREIGTFWLNIFCHPVITVLLFLLIVSHAVGIALVFLGIVLRIIMKKHASADEERDKKAFYEDMKVTSKYDSKKYVLARLILEDV